MRTGSQRCLIDSPGAARHFNPFRFHPISIVRVHIDGIIFSLQKHGGITTYFRELFKRFAPEHGVCLTLEQPLQQAFSSADAPAVERVERPGRTLERMRLARPPDDRRFDVYHSTYYRRPASSAQPSVVTVHDFVYQRFVHGPKKWRHQWHMLRAIRQAQRIICVSEATRQDLLEFVPIRSDQRVSVIHHGVADLFRPLQDTGTPAEIRRPFILFVGQRAGYKNFGLALSALTLLPDLELHCVGGGALTDEELSIVPPSTRDRVRYLGFVDDERLNLLYNQARCLLYPSLYEGFGIPVLEAMHAGCPVVCVDCKAVLEIGGTALSVSEDPHDPGALAKAIFATLDVDIRAKLRALGLQRCQQFSWDRCFDETLAVYRSLQP